MTLCPECASDLDLGHGHASYCLVPQILADIIKATLRGGWTDEELAERKREGIGGGAPRGKDRK